MSLCSHKSKQCIVNDVAAEMTAIYDADITPEFRERCRVAQLQLTKQFAAHTQIGFDDISNVSHDDDSNDSTTEPTDNTEESFDSSIAEMPQGTGKEVVKRVPKPIAQYVDQRTTLDAMDPMQLPHRKCRILKRWLSLHHPTLLRHVP